jgi:hypothetical protein
MAKTGRLTLSGALAGRSPKWLSLCVIGCGVVLLASGCAPARSAATVDPASQPVTVSPTEPPAESGLTIPADAVHGTVVDAATGERLADATVRWQTTEVSTYTEADGTFVLRGLPPGEEVHLTAFVPGYYISVVDAPGGEDGVEIALHRHPEADNPGYAWLPSGVMTGEGEDAGCAECHAAPADQREAGLMLPYDEWLLDAHSRAAVNPRFITMFTGTDLLGNQSPPTRYEFNRDYGRIPLPPDPDQPYYGPGYKLDFPNSDGNCATCHSPSAAIHAPHNTDPTQVEGVEREGISCDFCHKIWDVTLDPATSLPYSSRPGVMSLTFRRPPDGHQFFAGPLDDVAPGEDTHLSLQKESTFCAACHFGVFWNEVIYNSYGEWLESPYSDPVDGQTCQDCHMPPGGATHFVRPEAGGLIRDPATIASHRMPGAADETLLANTVDLSVEVGRAGDQIQVQVTLTNARAGHHVPTDSPLRQVFAVVQVVDSEGQALPLTGGPVLPDWAGDLAGMPGVYYARILEEVWTGVSPTGAYWNPTRLVEDTRLAAFAQDTSVYTFAAPADRAVSVQVEVVHRRAYYDLMQQKGWDDPDILMESAEIPVP